MSHVILKKKSIVTANKGFNISGKSPGGYWITRGPFRTDMLYQSIPFNNTKGFSLQGGLRSPSCRIQRDNKMSSQISTPFRGIYAIGCGGKNGKYYDENKVYTCPLTNTTSNQSDYIKPTVLSNFAMIENRFQRSCKGPYPNTIVSKDYFTGNQTSNKSQQMYIDRKISNHTCNLKINNQQDYINDYKSCGPTLCYTTPVRFTMEDMMQHSFYYKQFFQPTTYDIYNKYVQRQFCSSIESNV